MCMCAWSWGYRRRAAGWALHRTTASPLPAMPCHCARSRTVWTRNRPVWPPEMYHYKILSKIIIVTNEELIIKQNNFCKRNFFFNLGRSLYIHYLYCQHTAGRNLLYEISLPILFSYHNYYYVAISPLCTYEQISKTLINNWGCDKGFWLKHLNFCFPT